VVPSLGVQRTWQKTLGDGALRLVVPAYFLSSVILDWGDEEGLWLAVMLLLGLASLLDFVWPEARTSPKPIKLSKIAICLIALGLFASGGWRHFARTSIFGRGNVTATMVSVTPAQGGQGQILTLTISATGFSFTAGSKPNFGPDVRVLTNQVMNATTLLTTIQIAPGAPLGHRRVWVSTPGGQTAIDNTPNGVFQVVATASAEK
jgi:hypothetical protein